jgi:hypothetical protein
MYELIVELYLLFGQLVVVSVDFVDELSIEIYQLLELLL